MEKNIKLEEMEYKERRGEYPVLSFGEHEGRHFFIVSVGGEWPAAYVEAKPGEPDDCSLFDEMLEGKEYPHGGLTYGPEDLLRLKKSLEGQGVSGEILKLKYWGWDYGHVCDYCTWMDKYEEPEAFQFCYDTDIIPQKHTADEIYENDVIPFIEWINQKFSNTQNSGGEDK